MMESSQEQLQSSASAVVQDDPSKDFRVRYQLPEQFLWDLASVERIDFDGYWKVVLDLLPPAPAKVLDVGCGPGMGSKLLTERGYRVTGVDYVDRAVSYAKILVPDAEFFAHDVRLLADKSELRGRFDAAVHVEVIEHIPPDMHRQVLDGIRDSLKVGGRLVITVPSVRLPLNRWHYKHFREGEMESLLQGAGFKVLRTVGQHRLTPLFHPTFWRLLRNKYVDLRAARRAIRWSFLRLLNSAENHKAGRFIILAEKTESKARQSD